MYVKHIPSRRHNRKLQPLYDGLYRVMRKISEVALKLKNIRTHKEVSVHTDRVKVIHEGGITIKENGMVRKAYPLRDPDSDEMDLPSIYYEDRQENVLDNSSLTEESEVDRTVELAEPSDNEVEEEDRNESLIVPHDTMQTPESNSVPRYGLRSREP